jgi:precorrin-3B C17-methyltransferase
VNTGELYVVGLGPGHPDLLAPRARTVLAAADVVVGYRGYLALLDPWLPLRGVVATELTREVERAVIAVDRAWQGERVAVVSSGDAGVYGMAGLVLEVLAARNWDPEQGPTVEVVPGITAITAAAAVVGAPLMHDFAVVSLSDRLTPWPVIHRRLEAAAQADFVIGLYNPRSARRTAPLEAARRILLGFRRPDTPVAVVRNAYRPGQAVRLCTLETFVPEEVDMFTTVIVGNTSTRVYRGRLVTPRGYRVDAKAPQAP